jgi:hypothetical protein
MDFEKKETLRANGGFQVVTKLSPRFFVREKFLVMYEMAEQVQDAHEGCDQQAQPPHQRGQHGDHHDD